METVYIVAIVAIALLLALIVIVLRFGDRITGFRASGSARRGKTGIHGRAEIDAANPDGGLAGQPGVVVKGNRMKGNRQKMDIRHRNVQVERNTMEGNDQDLNIDEPDAPQDQRKKRKK